MSKAFTLIELLVITSIIIILSALALPSYKGGDKRLALQRAASKLAQDLRGAQAMAVSAKEYQGAVPSGYGIYFIESEPNHYLLFADNGDKRYSIGDRIVEDIPLEGAASLGKLSTGPSLTIVFTPPDPEITITPDAISASINIGQGEKNYSYEFLETITSHSDPRAGCDNNVANQECASTFSASIADPAFAYDWYQESGANYQYQWQENVSGHASPRAGCDSSVNSKDCASVFSAGAGDPSIIYDQYQETTGYQYVKVGIQSAFSNPRASHCDIDANVAECPNSFSDAYDYPDYVFDWFKSGSRSFSSKYNKRPIPIINDYSQKFFKISVPQTNNFSKKYQKKESSQNVFIVSVNKAGLIEID